MESRVVLAVVLVAAASTLAGCGNSKSHDSEHISSQLPPAPTGRFHCPSAAFVSDAVGFDVTTRMRDIICQYSAVGDPDSRWVEIGHERLRYKGRSLASLEEEFIRTDQLAGLNLFHAFPEGGPQAFVFTTSGPVATTGCTPPMPSQLT